VPRSSVPAAVTSRRSPTRLQAVLRAEHLGQPAVLTAASAATTRAAVAVLQTRDEQVKVLQGQVDAYLWAAPPTLRSCCPSLVWDRFWVPGCSPGFGDDPERYTDARARTNDAGTTPDHPRPAAKRRS
jgi:hypothetical protein